MRPFVCFGIKDDKKKVYSVSFFFAPFPIFLAWHSILHEQAFSDSDSQVRLRACMLLCLLNCFIEGGLFGSWAG